MTFDTNKIKGISIYDWMIKNGYKQGRGSSGKWRSFYSPFGGENNASFKVDVNSNKWVDYSAGVTRRQSIIDLVMKIESCEFLEACGILTNDTCVEVKEFEPKEVKPGVKIHSVENITDKGLLDYFLNTRKIDETVLRTYCSEIGFSFPFSIKDNTKIYKAIGFPTSMKSWELRSTFIKIASPPKSFSKIKGFSGDKCFLFEGWIDALSYLTHKNILTPEYDMYVLNGVHQIRLIKPFLENKDVYVYVDADEAGDGVIAEMDNCNPIDMRYTFPFANDYNKWWQDLDL